MMKQAVILTFLTMIAGCGGSGYADDDDEALASIWAALHAHCGNAYEGQVVSDDPQDATWRAETLTVEFRSCSVETVAIPLHVGADRSRIWMITRTPSGLRLKHDHRHEDGTEDAVSQYGGDSERIEKSQGRLRAVFPVDQFSIDLFARKGLTESITNVWTLELSDEMLAYELSREGRFFRAEFDITKTVAAPPPPWGEVPSRTPERAE